MYRSIWVGIRKAKDNKWYWYSTGKEVKNRDYWYPHSTEKSNGRCAVIMHFINSGGVLKSLSETSCQNTFPVTLCKIPYQ